MPQTLPDIARHPNVLPAIRAALAEDGADHDVTTLSLVDPAATVDAVILARHDYRTSGATVAEAVFHEVDPALAVDILLPDGSAAAPGAEILRIRGRAASILSGERVALNFMQRMTGIATATAAYVRAVEGTGCTILDTRKTVPGLRVLDKYAVLCGGGTNHRMGLHDMVLIKDNHRHLWRGADPTRLDQAIAAARARFPGIPVECEVETFEELESALRGAPEWIMLDNMPPADMARAVRIVAGRCKLEASGGINADTVRAAAESGVDAISIGALTHSVKAADLSLEISGWK